MVKLEDNKIWYTNGSAFSTTMASKKMPKEKEKNIIKIIFRTLVRNKFFEEELSEKENN